MTSGDKPLEAITPRKIRVLDWLRNWFITGIVVATPIGVTIWLVWSFVNFVDDRIKPLIPARWNPETYLPFALPGLGIVVAVIGLTLLGALTANLVGREFIKFGERVLKRLPLVSSIYGILKKMVETFAANDANAFKEAVLVEYPRKGLWSIAFITNTSPGGDIAAKAPGMVGLFVPTVPNPVTGFLMYAPAADLVRLNMPIEKAVKLIFSIGIVSADDVAAELGAPGKTIVKPPRVDDLSASFTDQGR